MRTRIIPIGNSRGIRIPKATLAELGWKDEVDVSVEGNTLVVRKARKPREGWEEALQAAREPVPLDREVATDFDKRDWRW
jgi:antitoxin MazE